MHSWNVNSSSQRINKILHVFGFIITFAQDGIDLIRWLATACCWINSGHGERRQYKVFKGQKVEGTSISGTYIVTNSTGATQRFSANHKTSTEKKETEFLQFPVRFDPHLWLVRKEQTLILLFWTRLVIGGKTLSGPGWVRYTEKRKREVYLRAVAMGSHQRVSRLVHVWYHSERKHHHIASVLSDCSFFVVSIWTDCSTVLVSTTTTLVSRSSWKWAWNAQGWT